MQELDTGQRYTVFSGNRKCCQYADYPKAIEHAESIHDGSVRIVKFTPQYTKRVKVRGNQVRLREFGVRQAECSRKLADAEGVQWYEHRT